MAKKRVRNKGSTVDPLRDLMRMVHSTKIMPGISKARSAAPSMSRALLDRLYELPVFRSFLQRHMFPADIALLSSVPPPHPAHETAEFLWTARLCGKHAEQLSEFAQLRDLFESKFIIGETIEAAETLERIFKKFGYSFWYLDNKFHLLQVTGGLVQQKEYLSELLATQGVNPLVGYFSYAFSLKAEPHISAHFIEALGDDLTKISPRMAVFFRYLINPFSLIEGSEIHRAINASENTSLIDRYQLLLRALPTLHVAQNGENAAFVLDCINELSPIADSALNTLFVLLGTDATVLDRGELHAFDLYTEGNYKEATELSLLAIRDAASQTSLWELFIRSRCYQGRHPEFDFPETSLAFQALQGMDQVTQMSPEYEQSFARIEKIAFTLGHSRFGLQLMAFARRGHAFSPNAEFSNLDKVWALSCSPLNPWHLEVLSQLSSRTKAAIVGQVSGSLSYELRAAVATLDVASLNSLPLPQDRKRGYLGQVELELGNVERAVQLFRENAELDNNLSALSAKESLFRALLALEDYNALISLVLSSYHENPISVFQYDLGSFINAVEHQGRVITDKLLYCNVLSIAVRFLGLSFESEMSDCFEDVLEAAGHNRASQFIEQAEEVGHNDLVYFFAHVCTVRTMEDSTKFEDMEAIDSERIKLCNWLTTNDPKSKATYSNEIRAITRSAAMSALRIKISDSKMYVDEAGVLQLLQGYLDDGYKRYQDLLKSPDANFQAERIAHRMGRLLEAQDRLESDKVASDFRRFKLPSNERQGLLRDLYETLVDRFLFSPEYGLDSHLSANVRHGTFVGQVRSPLAKRRLVTQRDKKTKLYDDNQYWTDRYSHLGESECREINQLLIRFSSKVDQLFNNTNDELLHVAGGKKQKGLFEFTEIDSVLNDISAAIDEDTEFEEFTRLLFDAAWGQTTEAMEVVRRHLMGPFEKEALRYLDLLDEDLERLVSRDRVPELADAIAKARAEFHSTVHGISQWFRAPLRVDDEPYTLDIIVDVAESEVKSCFGGQVIEIAKKISAPRPVTGRKVFGLIEILFILFQNAVLHCGIRIPEKLSISVEESDERLEVTVSNALSDEVDKTEREKLANDAIARYSAKYAIERVRTEGGSGLSKIWKTAEYNLKTEHYAEMQIIDNQFITRINLASGGLFA